MLPSSSQEEKQKSSSSEHYQQRQRHKQPKSYQSSTMNNFLYGIKSPHSKREYSTKLKPVFEHMGLSGSSLDEQAEAFIEKTKEENGIQWVENSIKKFIIDYNKRIEKGDLATSSVHNYFYAIKLFIEMNDDVISGASTINWKKIAKGLPSTSSSGNDRSPTVKELRKLIEYPERRIKAIVCTACSSGIRLGAWEHLRWKHVIPITNWEYLSWKKRKEEERGDEYRASKIILKEEDKQKIIAAKLIVYEGQGKEEEYYTFITPEAYDALKSYIIDFRKETWKEKITGDSPLIRDKLPESKAKEYGGAKWGLVTAPKLLGEAGIKKALDKAIWAQGLRTPLTEGKRRHEWKITHGFRKFFDTNARSAGMNQLNIELLEGHETGLADSYYKPEEMQLLDDYLKSVPLLTINYDYEKTALQKELQEATEQSKQNDNIIARKIVEKEREIEALKIQHQKEREQDKKAVAELFESKQKQFEERMEQWEERQERIFEELSLKHNPPLNQIKSKKKRAAEETKLMLEAGESAGIGGDLDDEGNPIPDIYDDIVGL
jgi:hypothetical protein